MRERKSSDKSIFPFSQPNIYNSVTNQKSNTRIEIPLKFDNTSPTHNSSKASSKVYLGNVNRALRKDVLKLRSIATCNLTHKAAKIPHVKLHIVKPSNNQLSKVSQNVIGSLRLNIHKQPSPTIIRKPSRTVTKFIYQTCSFMQMIHVSHSNMKMGKKLKIN